MGTIILGAVILLVAFVVHRGIQSQDRGGRASGALVNLVSLGLLVLGLLILTSSSVVVIDAGQVGVRHAFGKVDPLPLYSGVRFVPWSSVEKYSTREEQWPTERQGAETWMRSPTSR